MPDATPFKDLQVRDFRCRNARPLAVVLLGCSFLAIGSAISGSVHRVDFANSAKPMQPPAQGRQIVVAFRGRFQSLDGLPTPANAVSVARVGGDDI